MLRSAAMFFHLHQETLHSKKNKQKFCIKNLYEQKRIYITEDLFSHVVGYTDDDGKGIAGLEHYLYKNSILKDVFLTLDTRV